MGLYGSHEEREPDRPSKQRNLNPGGCPDNVIAVRRLPRKDKKPMKAFCSADKVGSDKCASRVDEIFGPLSDGIAHK
ncbi:hypothetical protein Mpet_2187 [Methanolacinia petrolearia DSM 11571]|uniref:Uncharacterized protein n=1 Tax=Methanolacinia petrolearia (strain DSM 11571 / OCM 486 / SEBR 4847) TaxID=679926 RepID=E1RKC2_METP4|nr:hypothetical protein Mpet_2187 [Methanolacinia petrolearia DSM 11571]